MLAHLGPCWWVGWWLWRAGCISQDTFLLYEVEKSSKGEESQEHPPILYEFNFGSLTNASLREIERELTEVSWFWNFHFISFSSPFCGI